MNQMPLPGQNPEAAIGVFPDHVLQRPSKFSGDSMLGVKFNTPKTKAEQNDASGCQDGSMTHDDTAKCCQSLTVFQAL